MRLPKYRNKKTLADGILFDSKKEATRYSHLKILLRIGEIKDLKIQVPYILEINGVKICKYVADFVYLQSKSKKMIVEDVKGVKTSVYRLKKKLMRAIHGIEIFET